MNRFSTNLPITMVNQKMADVSQNVSKNSSNSSDVPSPEHEICSNGESKCLSSSKSTPLPTSRTFVLNPPRLSNPFARKGSEVIDDLLSDKKIESKQESGANDEPDDTKLDKPETKGALSSSIVSFVPLCGDSNASSSTATTQSSLSQQSSSPALGFVFGQNIHEKVESAPPAETASAISSDSTASFSESPAVTTNGTTSEMLFSTGVKKESQPEKLTDSSGKTLSEAAREYEEARAVKRKFEAVQVITGEEEEANVLQINCKLFSWSSCSWVERGRGTLRVNDLPTNPPSHRLIVRVAGSLRLVLNTKIWSGMTVDRASVKSMRITGMDSNGVVKVFLLMASPKEMDQLQKCLEWRVNNLKKSEDSTLKKSKAEEEALKQSKNEGVEEAS